MAGPTFGDEAIRALAGPYRGECGFCGGPDARHRVLDAIAERVRAGEDPEDVADDYRRSVDAVRTIAANWRGERRAVSAPVGSCAPRGDDEGAGVGTDNTRVIPEAQGDE